MSKILVEQIASVIDMHKDFIMPERVIPLQDLSAMFNEVFPELTSIRLGSSVDAIKVVNAYSKINKVLAFRGLQLKSKNYYSNFYVTSVEQSKAKVKQHRHKAKGNKKAALHLKSSINRNPSLTWSALSSPEINYCSTYITKPLWRM